MLNNNILGKFQVCVGPMGSGKTSRVIGFLLKNEKRFKAITKKKRARILLVRPSKDSRIDDQYVFKTHDNYLYYDVREHENVNVIVLAYGCESELLTKYQGYDIYIFDEGQFFEIGIARILSKLSFAGQEIYFTGLLHDFKDEIFTTTQAVMTLPEVSSIKKLHNQCSLCGNNGFLSARMLNGKILNFGPQIVIGDLDNKAIDYSYIGVCAYCKKIALG